MPKTILGKSDGRETRVAAQAAQEQDLRAAVSGYISHEALPVDKIVSSVLGRYHVDPQEVVAVVWDLVEDEDLIYDASARVRRA